MTEPIKLTSGPFKGMEVTVAPQQRIVRLRVYVDRILTAIGFSGALVTDESSISDFDLSEMDLAMAAKSLDPDNHLRLDILQTDYIADIAEKLAGTQ